MSSAAATGGTTIEPQRVLLLEDSDIDAELIGIHLERTGAPLRLVRARSRAEYLRVIHEAASGAVPLDLILADYSLPDIDGVAALEIAQAQLPDVPLVFISGVGGEELATDALRRGAIDYVLKRNLGRLSTSVLRALSEHRERRRRREAELALVKSEATMRLALDAATLGLWHLDLDGSMGCDARCAQMLGIDPAARLDRSGLLERVHPADRAALEAALQAALGDENRPAASHECRVLDADGSLRWVVLRGRRVSGDGVVRLSGVMQEVTATRLLESRQREAEMLFKLATQATGLGIWEIGPAPDQVWVDAGYRQIAGLDGAEEQDSLAAIIGRIVHPDDRAALGEALDRVLRHDRDTLQLEHRIVRFNDGAVRWLAIDGRRIEQLDGHSRLVGTARDITESRRLQALLEASHEDLERRVAERTRELTAEIAERGRVEDTLRRLQRLEAVGQLTSGVAHDFNNLLSVVLTNIMLIRRSLAQHPDPDERLLKRLNTMRDAASRGATLTRQLLAFSRRQRLEPQSVDMNEIVRDMRDLLQTTLGGSVHLETRLAEDVWHALVDPTQMELIILNLAINARDAMEVGGHLQIATSNVVLTDAPTRPEEPEAGEYVALSVSDTGTGMTDEVLAKAFEPFFTTKPVGVGTGLGLAQVFGFAKQSGGGISIRTELGQGTTVHVYIPRSETPAPSPAGRHATPDAPAPGRNVTLLLVDDDVAVREATAELLGLHGYRVAQVGDASAALRHLDEVGDVDLVIADFAMPLMNGAEMARLVHQKHPTLPVLFVTGYADLTILRDVPNSLLLQKPVQEADLLARIGEALGARELRRSAGPIVP